MYYDNIVISDLMAGDHIEHHGVLGMKWGIRRYQSYSQVPRKSGEGGKEQGLAKKKAKLEAKKVSNSAKLAKYKEKQNSPEAKARRAKIDEYTGKANKVNSSIVTRRAEYNLYRGKDTGALGDINLRKKTYYESRASKFLAEEAKLNAKIADLEYKNLKIDRKLSKIETKKKINEINSKRNAAKEKIKNAYKNQDPNNQYQFTKNDRDVTLRFIDSEYDKDVWAAKRGL